MTSRNHVTFPLEGKNAKATMADHNKTNQSSVKSPQLSDYVRTLSVEARERYVNKLRYQSETCILPDPYNLQAGWVEDPSMWPDITFTDIYFYLVDTPGQFTHDSLKAFKSLRAYEYVKSGHVFPIFYQNVEQTPFCFLKTKVIPSQRLRDKPHQPWVCVKKSEGTVYCAHCTCMAGLGEVCSHVAALLFKVDAAVRAGLTSKACTSEACKWNSAYRKQLHPTPISEIENIMSSRKKPSTTATVSASGTAPLPDADVLKSLQQVCPHAVFFKSIPNLDDEETDSAEEEIETSTFPATLTSLASEDTIPSDNIMEICERKWESVKSTTEQVKNLEEVTRNQAISPLWYEHRRGRITGTKAHDIFVMKTSTGPRNNIMKVMGYNVPDISKKAAVAWGTDNEARARKQYTIHQETQHTNFTCSLVGLLICEQHPYIAVSSDGVVTCTCCGKGCVEVKCPYKHKDHDIHTASRDKNFCLDSDLHLKKKHRYYTQVQMQMYVHDVMFCDVVVFTNIDMAIIRVSRDDTFLTSLISKCHSFFFEHVLPEIVTRRLEKARPLSKDSVAESEDVWCLCQQREHGRMIMCEGPNCSYTWFHYECVNIRRKPKGSWFCPSCIMG